MFSTVSFLITLRESIEAALIIGILLTYVKKIGHKELRKDIWIGTSVAILTSIGAALAFYFTIGGLNQFEEIIEGFAMIFAAIILTWMIIWMMKTGKDVKSKLEKKIDLSVNNGQRFGLIFLAFISVAREGIETVLFMVGVIAVEESVATILWSGFAGIAVSLVIAVAIFWSGQKINLKQFFNFTGAILIIFAAGLFIHGLHEFQELGWFGSDSSFLQRIIWDTSSILNDKTAELGKFLRALIGYQDKPTWLELIAYIVYLIGITLVVIIIKVPRKRSKQQTSENDLLLSENRSNSSDLANDKLPYDIDANKSTANNVYK
ncbi:MAG: FTR1 family iron permease [Candidatus Heimdallarchaeota archaeon]